MATAQKEQAAKSSNPAGIIKRTNAYFIDPMMIDRKEGFNPRFDFGDIDELAKSIKKQKEHDGVGVLRDLEVKRKADGRFELLDGDRRLTAVMQLISKGEVFEQGIPAKILDKNIADVQALVRMFEANTGKPFLPLEEAAAYKRMRDAGMTIKQVCEAVSRKHVHVISTLALLQADDSVKEGVASGKLNSTMAKQIATKAKGNKAKQAELVEKATKGKVGKKEVIKELEKTKTSAKGKARQALVDTLAPEPLTQSQIQRRIMLIKKVLKELNVEDFGFADFTNKDAPSYAFGMLHGLMMATGDESIKIPKSE